MLNRSCFGWHRDCGSGQTCSNGEDCDPCGECPGSSIRKEGSASRIWKWPVKKVPVAYS